MSDGGIKNSKSPNRSKNKIKNKTKNSNKKQKQKQSKNKSKHNVILSKMSHKKSSLRIPTFEVMRKRLSRLDLIERRYYLTIERETEKVILSPTADYHLEPECEFGLHQIIVGDYQSTLIQIKTLSGKHIFYEFDFRQNKDEFVDLLDEIKHESEQNGTRERISSSELLPRGSGFSSQIHMKRILKMMLILIFMRMNAHFVKPHYVHHPLRIGCLRCLLFILLSVSYIYIISIHFKIGWNYKICC